MRRSFWRAWCPRLAVRRAVATGRRTVEVDFLGQPDSPVRVRSLAFGRVRLFVNCPF